MKLNENIISKIALLLISIVALLLAIENYSKTKEIENIKKTKYEFCYVINNQKYCGYQKIGDYLKGLD